MKNSLREHPLAPLAAPAALVVVGLVLLASWKLDLVRGGEKASQENESLSERFTGDRGLVVSGDSNDLADGNSHLVDGTGESGTPRVSPTDKIASVEEGKPDAGEQ